MLICGVDEAGRGPWAGPVVAAAVILMRRAPNGIGDSKTLSAAERAFLEPRIRRAGVVGVGLATVEEIDRLNIRVATFLAMRRAVEALGVAPGLIRVDGREAPDLGAPVTAIVAKETRDRMMAEACAFYPGYGFARHKGYGVAAHAAALAALGPTPLHRMSFAPVRAAAARIGLAA
jgi:ribonuclease HII